MREEDEADEEARLPHDLKASGQEERFALAGRGLDLRDKSRAEDAPAGDLRVKLGPEDAGEDFVAGRR